MFVVIIAVAAEVLWRAASCAAGTEGTAAPMRERNIVHVAAGVIGVVAVRIAVVADNVGIALLSSSALEGGYRKSSEGSNWRLTNTDIIRRSKDGS